MSLKRFFLVCISVLPVCMWGCKGLNEDEPVPSYIHIPSITLQTKTDGSQGSNAADIVDAWVYANKQLIGVFQPPVTLPILKTGNTEITVFAGIKKNGRTADRVTYPFYAPFVQQVNLAAARIDTILPVVKYKDFTRFAWIEDFEDQSESMQKTGNAATIDTLFVTNNPQKVFQFDGNLNNYSGLVKFNGIGTFEHATIGSFDIQAITDVYLEVNYKSDVNVQFGFLSVGTFTYKIPVVLGFATDTWKKLYIGFTEDFNSNDYHKGKLKVYVEAVNSNAAANPEILLDNLKLVTY